MLVVSPHGDDETLGAGGTLLRFKKEGHKIYWLNFTDKKQEYGYSAQDTQLRTRQMKDVVKAYSFDGLYNLGLKPAGLNENKKNEIIEEITNIFKTIKPSILILPFKNDVHSDHRYVFETVYSCTKIFRAPFIKKILMMEVLSETDFASSDKGFVPNYFVDISNYLDKKIKIMRYYQGEMGKHPFPRSEENIRALAVHRGATAGCRYAEAFMLIKGIW